MKRERKSPNFNSDSGDEFVATTKARRKRKKVDRRGSETAAPESATISLEPLLHALNETQSDESSFDAVIESLLPIYVPSRDSLQRVSEELDAYGQLVRPLTKHEAVSTIETYQVPFYSPQPYRQAITVRKLKIGRQLSRAGIPIRPAISIPSANTSIFPLTSQIQPQADSLVFESLADICSTPFENSFLARLHGTAWQEPPNLFSVDWETVSPWIELLRDIRAHHGLAYPERSQEIGIPAAIMYAALRQEHLLQVHDLLARSFWTGVDVSDSLEYSPEKCTVVATYKRLVVGVAIISSPRETYITYLAVRAGWENSQIATSMLYHLIMLNPHKDITLHVSANNPAMLLYNRFGFKAEEFVAGFYEDYLDPSSRASKNAFRLRLRR